MTSGRVLVLLQRDDESEMVARLLATTCGFEVDLTTDPAAALNHLPGSHINGIVLGMELGRERGTRVLEAIRGLRDPSSSVPVVLVAERDAPADRVAAWEAGADGIVTKPFHINALVEAIRTAMQRSARQRERTRQQAAAEARRR